MEQSAFIKGRFILDGALIVNETIDYLKGAKEKGLLFKVDFEKAFDCLNWGFLLEVMTSMGFGSKWRQWIFSCLNSATISILEVGINFRGSFIKTVSKNSKLLFWENQWLTISKLKDSYPRLYRLDLDQQAMICDRVAAEGSGHKLCSNWARGLRGRAVDELEQLTKLIEEYNFNNSGCDTCSWSISHNGTFSVRTLSLLVDKHLIVEDSNVEETMRNNLVPKKLEIFIWRACQKRLPVLFEIDKRGIDLHSVRCLLCDEDLETVEHSLIFCKLSLDIWDRVFAWWGFRNMSNLSLSEILRGKCPLPSSILGTKIWQAVEWVCAYLIWKNRNEKVFRGKSWTAPVALNEIQLKSFD
ncbi:uncharacterized protein [Rutidosis leptorrhynchoides]|uniref:uncharacterized protein n=1 Tax=Rutidosis leptorrhynchoides TaxID=125765 RepID=UPI003A9A40AE